MERKGGGGRSGAGAEGLALCQRSSFYASSCKMRTKPLAMCSILRVRDGALGACVQCVRLYALDTSPPPSIICYMNRATSQPSLPPPPHTAHHLPRDRCYRHQYHCLNQCRPERFSHGPRFNFTYISHHSRRLPLMRRTGAFVMPARNGERCMLPRTRHACASRAQCWLAA